MSSNHTRVDREEWREMQRQVYHLESYIMRNETQLHAYITQHFEALERIRQEIAEHTRVVEQSIANLAGAYNTNLQQVRGMVQDQMDQANADFQQQLTDLMESVTQVSSRLGQTNSRLDAMASSYQAIFQQRLAQEESRQRRAEMTLEELDRLLAQLEPLQPQRHRPVDYATVQTMRNAVSQNISGGDYQAALTVSQNGVMRVSRLLGQLAMDNDAYNRQVEAVRTEAANLQDRVNRLADPDGVLSVTVQEQRQEFEYDIEYWSGGEFSRLQSELNQLQSRLTAEDLTPAEVSRLWEQVNQLQDRLDQCDHQARGALAGSVFVEETADRLRQVLEDRGWEATLDEHHEEDARAPYTMELDDGSGNIVSLVVSRGVREEEPIYSLEVYSDDEYRAAEIKDGIHSAMEDGDFTLGNVEHRNDCHLNPDPETFRQNMVQEAQQRQQCQQN